MRCTSSAPPAPTSSSWTCACRGSAGIEAAVRIRDAFPDVVVVFMSVDLASLPADDRERMASWPQVEKRLLRSTVLASLWETHRPR